MRRSLNKDALSVKITIFLLFLSIKSFYYTTAQHHIFLSSPRKKLKSIAVGAEICIFRISWSWRRSRGKFSNVNAAPTPGGVLTVQKLFIFAAFFSNHSAPADK